MPINHHEIIEDIEGQIRKCHGAWEEWSVGTAKDSRGPVLPGGWGRSPRFLVFAPDIMPCQRSFRPAPSFVSTLGSGCTSAVARQRWAQWALLQGSPHRNLNRLVVIHKR